MRSSSLLMSIITLKGLSKKYGKKTVVNNLSLEIKKSCFAFLGPNGAGKTTTLLMILGLIKPLKGEITILGKNIKNQSKLVRQKVGFLPENVGFYPSKTGRELVALILELRTKQKQTTEQIDSNLKWCGLKEEYWDKKTKSYSQGMRQRLGIALAFAGNPEIVVLDEPFSNIDPLGREDFINKINVKQKQGITILISSHITSDVEKLADTVTIIDDGVVKISDSIFTLMKNLEYDEYEIFSNKFQANDVITKINEIYLDKKEWFLEPPTVLRDSLIVKTKFPYELKTYLENFNNFEIKPLTGVLQKIYKLTMEG